jgi:hypothetical protein
MSLLVVKRGNCKGARTSRGMHQESNDETNNRPWFCAWEGVLWFELHLSGTDYISISNHVAYIFYSKSNIPVYRIIWNGRCTRVFLLEKSKSRCVCHTCLGHPVNSRSPRRAYVAFVPSRGAFPTV